MDKKYQVFVSSTYKDLIDERKEVIQALLELECIPIGMELFPAADEEQWEFIKSVIDECDYYVLILGGRYGSCASNGIGYTEMEYRYALETNKPIISFLHSNPGSIPADKIDTSPELVAKLSQFKELAQKKLCRYWSSPAELAGVLGRSIVQLKKRSPSVGWVRADNVPDDGTAQEILRLKKQIENLEKQLSQTKDETGINTRELAQGDDIFKILVRATAKKEHNPFDRLEHDYDTEITWNKLFFELAPLLIDEVSETQLKTRINQFLARDNSDQIWEFEGFESYDAYSCNISRSDFETIIVQLRALGLIQKGIKNRSVKDQQTYWCLTEKGDQTMVGLRALRKEC